MASKLVDEAQKLGATPADDLDAPPFDDDDAQQDTTSLAAYLMQGVTGVKEGERVEEAAAGPQLIDQEDLEGQPFALLHARIQQKIAIIQDKPTLDYEFIICAAQPVNIDGDGVVTEAGGIFLFIAGRTNSVLGEEMMSYVGVVTPDKPVLFKNGIRRKDLGNGQHYYTTRPERDPKASVNLFPNRKRV